MPVLPYSPYDRDAQLQGLNPASSMQGAVGGLMEAGNVGGSSNPTIPEDPTQRYSRPLPPEWAKWFDMAKAAGVNKVGGMMPGSSMSAPIHGLQGGYTPQESGLTAEDQGVIDRGTAASKSAVPAIRGY